MGLMFFMSGYFVPSSLKRKGEGRFVVERLKRLGIPALLFILIIGPGIVYSLYWSNTSLISYYAGYIGDPTRYESGPLWFAIALLIFTMVYLVLKDHVPVISNRSFGNRELFGLAIVMAIGSFLIRLVFPIGSAVWNMQIPFFFQYVVLFALGIMARQNGWLEDLPKRTSKVWKYLTIFLAVLAWPVLMAAGGALEGDYSSFMGGLNWQSLALAIWEQTFCVAASVSLLIWYKRRMNYESRSTRFLSKNAFAVYVFHAPVLIALSLLLASINLPVIMKFVGVVLATVLMTYSFSHFLRRLPLFKDIF
jgi:glucan biosynthesis protein C